MERVRMDNNAALGWLDRIMRHGPKEGDPKILDLLKAIAAGIADGYPLPEWERYPLAKAAWSAWRADQDAPIRSLDSLDAAVFNMTGKAVRKE